MQYKIIKKNLLENFNSKRPNINDFKILNKKQLSIWKFWQSPYYGVELDFERDKSLNREIDL